jgi:hypothetical protein
LWARVVAGVDPGSEGQVDFKTKTSSPRIVPLNDVAVGTPVGTPRHITSPNRDVFSSALNRLSVTPKVQSLGTERGISNPRYPRGYITAFEIASFRHGDRTRPPEGAPGSTIEIRENASASTKRLR